MELVLGRMALVMVVQTICEGAFGQSVAEEGGGRARCLERRAVM